MIYLDSTIGVSDTLILHLPLYRIYKVCRLLLCLIFFVINLKFQCFLNLIMKIKFETCILSRFQNLFFELNCIFTEIKY